MPKRPMAEAYRCEDVYACFAIVNATSHGVYSGFCYVNGKPLNPAWHLYMHDVYANSYLDTRKKAVMKSFLGLISPYRKFM